ncbi:Aminomethyltransferase folate-binding domain-containing protein [Coccomyxa subellipsoidea C-169]|uniref:Aminomethyltransferase folate-binding domain-containing protein n=1 Tax=Coccomyxa subellipsoidea (strain C-169) TaxID=574566 RepID=I0Z3U6_COCSC|nr:Aminomethyltransferase folate-binding domain-containing protein [Coccomyxa subellipsoidea C-169]EIE25315.1 Aminomethyltransferase folate-binding domain-containing protein [Coccomyxa subellipsoidea C-169]|eukprot:XP_005649859.1 Aminomethyltransferase folate-binding domain-containing protein [Coccomyxa subellipsoidea C-169]
MRRRCAFSPDIAQTASCKGVSTALNALSFDLDIPEIDCDLRTAQEDQGAIFEGTSIPVSFGNDEAAGAALENGVVIVDRTHWGRLRVSGDDRLKFLHGQSTADFLALQPGTGCRTVFVNRNGRTIDLASCLVQGSSIMVIVSPLKRTAIKDRLEQYIFFGDKVEVQDISSSTVLFTLAGPGSDELMTKLGAGSLVDREEGSHAVFGAAGQPVVVSVAAELGVAGYSIVASEGIGGDLWQRIVGQGAVPMGEAGWERARVLAGRPAVDHELTDLYNPLEAGLCSAVSITKGCYIGQETLSKLTNLDALKQQLWGLDLSAPASVGDEISDGSTKVGVLTSTGQRWDGSPFALGYIRAETKQAVSA